MSYPDKNIEAIIGGTNPSTDNFTESFPLTETSSTTQDGQFTYAGGFPSTCSAPLESGGVAPRRRDWNGFARLVSKWLWWFNRGGYAKYDASLSYEVGAVVYLNGERYWCVQANSSSSPVTPGTDTNYWKPFTRTITLTGDVTATGSLGKDNLTLSTTALQANKVKNKLTINGTEYDGSAAKTVTINPNIAPIGAITAYAGTGTYLPTGWKWCNGQSVTKAAFPDLFDVIQYTYGGSGNNFNLPNIMDHRFIEGSPVTESGTTVIGTRKSDGLPDIQGTIHPVFEDNYIPAPTGAFRRSGTAYEADGTSYTSENKGYAFRASWYNSIYGNSTKVQPKSIWLPYIIRCI